MDLNTHKVLRPKLHGVLPAALHAVITHARLQTVDHAAFCFRRQRTHQTSGVR
jgi:hypothetical protein